MLPIIAETPGRRDTFWTTDLWFFNPSAQSTTVEVSRITTPDQTMTVELPAFGSRRITNALGALQEVRGDGVVGEQPVLKPGEAFEYTSGTPLSTPSGIMGGNYQMVTSGGDAFEIDIPTFSLDSPYEGHAVH